MHNLALKVENLGKRYRVGQPERYRTLRDTIAHTAKKPIRGLRRMLGQLGPAVPDSFLWALDDVSFELPQGEVLGIIGRNGAGKSTLLKVLSRITRPTTGRARIWGKVGSLLEVGTGFHPELSGRENIYLSGAILGMSKAEIRRKFDEIVAFAEVERFLDTALKHYSSGMYMRLAFAVAAHMQPDILLVDEVLAVGDVAFQKKCLGKMQNVAQAGRTVLFVSHNLLAVQALCDSVLLLEQGKVTSRGRPAEVIARYLQDLRCTATTLHFDDPGSAPGDERVRLRRATVRAANAQDANITVRTPLVLEFEYWNLGASILDVTINVFNEYGILVFNSGTYTKNPAPHGLLRSTVRIPGDLLNNGLHRVEVFFVENEGNYLWGYPDALVFEVLDALDFRSAYYDQWPGALRPALDWTTEIVQLEAPPVCSPALTS